MNAPTWPDILNSIQIEPTTYTDDKLIDIQKKVKRVIYYCNITGIPIMKLNERVGIKLSKINSNKCYTGIDDKFNKDIIDWYPDYYNEPYRVYKCGHCFFEKELRKTVTRVFTGELTGYGYSDFSCSKINSFLEEYFKKINSIDCILCDYDMKDRRYVYGLFHTSCFGNQEVKLIFSKNMDPGDRIYGYKSYQVDLNTNFQGYVTIWIPKQYLEVLETEQFDQDIATETYRFTDRYIYDKDTQRYEKIECDDSGYKINSNDSEDSE